MKIKRLRKTSTNSLSKTQTDPRYTLEDTSRSFQATEWNPDAAIVEKLLWLHANAGQKHLLDLNTIDSARIVSLEQKFSLPNYLFDGDHDHPSIKITIKSYSIKNKKNAELYNRVILRNFNPTMRKASDVFVDEMLFKTALNNPFIGSYFTDGGCEARAFFTLELFLAAGFNKNRVSYCYLYNHRRDKNNKKSRETLSYTTPDGKLNYYRWHVAICIDQTLILDSTANKNKAITIEEWLDYFNFNKGSVINFDPISCSNKLKNRKFYLPVEKADNYLLFLPCGFRVQRLSKSKTIFKITHFLKKNGVVKMYFLNMLGTIHHSKHEMFTTYFDPSEGPFQKITEQLSPLNLEIAICKYIASNLIQSNQKLLSIRKFFLLIAEEMGLNRLLKLLAPKEMNEKISSLSARGNSTLFAPTPDLETDEGFESPSEFDSEYDSSASNDEISDTLLLYSSSDFTRSSL